VAVRAAWGGGGVAWDGSEVRAQWAGQQGAAAQLIGVNLSAC